MALEMIHGEGRIRNNPCVWHVRFKPSWGDEEDPAVLAQLRLEDFSQVSKLLEFLLEDSLHSPHLTQELANAIAAGHRILCEHAEVSRGILNSIVES